MNNETLAWLQSDRWTTTIERSEHDDAVDLVTDKLGHDDSTAEAIAAFLLGTHGHTWGDSYDEDDLVDLEGDLVVYIGPNLADLIEQWAEPVFESIPSEFQAWIDPTGPFLDEMHNGGTLVRLQADPIDYWEPTSYRSSEWYFFPSQ